MIKIFGITSESRRRKLALVQSFEQQNTEYSIQLIEYPVPFTILVSNYFI